MPSVAELSAPYANFMLGPRPGPDVCELCFNFTRGYRRCYACTHNEDWLAAVAPISYSVGGEQLHRALMVYKRLNGEVARRLEPSSWRRCCGVTCRRTRDASRRRLASSGSRSSRPSRPAQRERDPDHPLRGIVGELVGPTRDRYEPLLERSAREVAARAFEPDKFESSRALDGASGAADR